MACGVPVVYAASGGTVELVGDEAGLGVEHPESWERQQPPTPEALAEALERVIADLSRYRAAARRRAVERFSLGTWLDHHAGCSPSSSRSELHVATSTTPARRPAR